MKFVELDEVYSWFVVRDVKPEGDWRRDILYIEVPDELANRLHRAVESLFVVQREIDELQKIKRRME